MTSSPSSPARSAAPAQSATSAGRTPVSVRRAGSRRRRRRPRDLVEQIRRDRTSPRARAGRRSRVATASASVAHVDGGDAQVGALVLERERHGAADPVRRRRRPRPCGRSSAASTRRSVSGRGTARADRRAESSRGSPCARRCRRSARGRSPAPHIVWNAASPAVELALRVHHERARSTPMASASRISASRRGASTFAARSGIERAVERVAHRHPS